MKGFLAGLIIGAGAVLAALHYYAYIDLNEFLGGAPQAELLTFENPKTACNGAGEDCASAWSEIDDDDAGDAE